MLNFELPKEKRHGNITILDIRITYVQYTYQYQYL